MIYKIAELNPNVLSDVKFIERGILASPLLGEKLEKYHWSLLIGYHGGGTGVGAMRRDG